MTGQQRTAEITITVSRRDGLPRPHLVRVRARDPWPGDKRERSYSYRVKAEAMAKKRRFDEALAAGEPIDPATLEPYSWAAPLTATTWFEHVVSATQHFRRGWESSTRKINTDMYAFLACAFGGTPPVGSAISRDAVRRAAWLAIKHGDVHYEPQAGDELRHYRKRDVTADIEEIAAGMKWLRENSWPVACLDQVKVELALELLSVRLDGKPYASGGIKQRRSAMNKVLGRAVFLGLLPDNPLKKVQVEQKKSQSKRTIKQVTKAQVLELEEIMHALEVALQLGGVPALCIVVWALCGLAGLRPGEALEARWSNLTLPAADAVERNDKEEVIGRAFGTLVIEGSRTEHGEWADDDVVNPQELPLKHRSDDETRTIQLVPELCDILRQAQTRRLPGCDYVAADEHGLQLTHSAYQGAWQRVRKKAFQGRHSAVVSYDLRHSFISAALRTHYPLPLLAEDVGNTVPVLLETYARVMPNDATYAREAMRRMHTNAA